MGKKEKKGKRMAKVKTATSIGLGEERRRRKARKIPRYLAGLGLQCSVEEVKGEEA